MDRIASEIRWHLRSDVTAQAVKEDGMTLTEGFIKDSIYIDFGTEVMYGSDQVYVDYPCRFATVTFELVSTEALAQIADWIRAKEGYAPMHPMEGWTEDNCDQEGWYSFYIGLNGLSCTRLDSCIGFTVANSLSPDNEEMYTIDLTDYEQGLVYDQLDAQCRKYLGKSCAGLLAEAGKELEEENEGN